MSQTKTTKEERLLLAIARASKNASAPINVEQLAATLGFSEKQAQKAINLLARANCILKRGEWDVEITQHGLRTIDHL